MEKIEYSNPQENIKRGEDPIHRVDLIVDGKIIGAAEIEYFSKPFPIYQISELYVEYEYKSKGYASKILDYVEAMLKKKKKTGVLVDAIMIGADAEGMYERRGWQPIPGGLGQLVYNLPKGRKIEELKNYHLRQKDIMERESWKKANK